MLDVRLLKNSVLFRLKNSCKWGNSGKGTLTESAIELLIGPAPGDMLPEEAASRIMNAKAAMKLGKRLIECDEYQAVKWFQSDTKARLMARYCNQSFIDEGLYTVKTDALPFVIADIKDAQAQLIKLVQAFLLVYESKVNEARATLGDQFDERNYPSVGKLAQAFAIEYRVVQLDIPEGLPPEIRAEEEAKLRASFERAEQELTRALREGFGQILAHVTDRLTPGPDGKRKKFTDTIFVEFVEFLESFGNKNILGDDRLAALVEKAKGIWTNVANGSGQDLSKAAQRVREIEPVRERTLAALAEIKEAVDASITELPGRAFDFEE